MRGTMLGFDNRLLDAFFRARGIGVLRRSALERGVCARLESVVTV